MAFYVSSQAQYTISPEVPAAIVWDGAVAPRHRLLRRRASCGCGSTAARSARARRRAWPIAYTTGSKGVYIGTYRGSCDLGFQRRDRRRRGVGRPPGRGDDRPGDRARRPARRRTIAIGPGRRRRRLVDVAACERQSARLPARSASAAARSRCAARRGWSATVRRDGLRVAGVRIVVSGKGVTTTRRAHQPQGHDQDRRAGAQAPGASKVKVRGQKAGCPALTVRAR